MTLLYFDDRFQLHETGRHPENPRRTSAIVTRLHEGRWNENCTCPTWSPCSLAAQRRVHDTAYLKTLAEFAEQGGGQIEQDTVMSPASLEVSCLAAGAACDAVDRVLRGEDNQAFCVIRPPGHHALRGSAMGFCLLNNVAVAAAHALQTVDRVLIVDWDVHHGNGTQAIFWEDPRVGFYSLHRWPFYPGTGDASETGSGSGLGSTMNVPIEFGTPVATILGRFASSLERFAAQLRPQLVLVSAGFDAHRLDPVGSLQLDTDDFRTLTQVVQTIAAEHCEGRLVSLLEGGYHPRALADCVIAHLESLGG